MMKDFDIYLFNEGKSRYAYKMLGCHKCSDEAYEFMVYAPNAFSVSLIGSFNDWNMNASPMSLIGTSGIWYIKCKANENDLYKFAVKTKRGKILYKADPFAFMSEIRPKSASQIFTSAYEWNDKDYISHSGFDCPMNIYEVHLGSWKQGLSYRQLAKELVEYVCNMGYTHVEIMPICEYPYDKSWGYQVTGYYSPTSRYGSPDDFKFLIDSFHKAGIGVILDWVCAHYPKDEHGLYMFDGSFLYESSDKLMREQMEWGTVMFDYSKKEVQSFLISNAIYFLKEFHIDGLRLDAVSSMLYLDYGKKQGQWRKSEKGDNINYDAVRFLQNLAEAVGYECPEKILIAEESTAFPLVTKPPYVGGLGFHYKWDMGYMHDTLDYFSMPVDERKNHIEKLTFSMHYAFSENFVLPFSHDEVVHSKCSMINKIQGSYEEKFALLRLLYAYQYTHTGKKLNFMGNEIAQFMEWNEASSIEYDLLKYEKHRKFKYFVECLNKLYKSNKPFYEIDTSWDGFKWVSVDESCQGVIAYMRTDKEGKSILCAFNFTPEAWEKYEFHIDGNYVLNEKFNTDDSEFGGAGRNKNQNSIMGKMGKYPVSLPPYSSVIFDVELI